MTIDRLVLVNAALAVLITVTLAYSVDPLWLWATGAVGVQMLQAALTGWCPQAMLFRKLGVRSGPSFG